MRAIKCPASAPSGSGVCSLSGQNDSKDYGARPMAPESLRLIVRACGIIAPTTGVIIIAGGEAFGGAGSLIHL